MYQIERLTPPVSESDLRELAGLLVDAVESGAAVSFLSPLSVDQASRWWAATLSGSHPGAIYLAARNAGAIVGTVQLQPAWAPNQPHRGEVVKMLVHRQFRGQGLGAELMRAIESAAWEAGFRLLTLDAKAGGAAERLYQRAGWTALGTIPRYALDPDGKTPHGAVFFFKHLSGPGHA